MARKCFTLAVMSGMAFSTAVAAMIASAARSPDESPYILDVHKRPVPHVLAQREHGKRQLGDKPLDDPHVALVACPLKQLHQRLDRDKPFEGSVDGERCPTRATLRIDEDVRIKDHDIARP